jgi:sugar transferase EpsL
MTEPTSRKKFTLGWLGCLTLAVLIIGSFISLSRRNTRVVLFEARPTVPRRRMPGSAQIKRLIDISMALATLIVFSPVLLVVALAVRIRHGSPVLFRQTRPGLNGEPFEILKFRTMTDARDICGDLLPDAQRLTALGKFLRRTSLDELPELLNVLKGDMSLVGPRPLRMRYLERYTPRQARRHEVKPGITGWAQVNGRNGLPWEDRFEMDVWYVDHWSLWLDLKIIFLTVWKVLKQDGISQEGHVTMTEFKGYPTGEKAAA